MQKSELLNHLRQKKQQWEALLDEIGPARLEQPGVNGEWSMKDIIAHLTGWNHWLVARFQAALRGAPEPAPSWPSNLQSDDEINAWIYDTNHERSLAEVLDAMRQSNQQLLTLVDAMPEDLRIEHVEPAYYLVWVGDERFVVGEFFDHFHDDHEPDVRAWLARSSSHSA